MRALLLPALTLSLAAQNPPILPQAKERALLHPTWKAQDPAQRQRAFAAHRALEAQSPFKVIPFQCVGPMAQGGRVMAVAMDDRKPETWMAAFATGGLWITHTDGRTWEPLFEKQEGFAIGDLAVTWGEPGVPKTIWVGTGEASNTRTVYMGAGLFRSDDQGKSWKKVALGDAHHIGRVVIHPSNPGVVFVAALGPVYTEGGERGLFRTTDGGKTWKQVLVPAAHTGAIDVLVDWQKPDVVYACTWERHRKAWNFIENGEGSGLWKSTDGGTTFQRLAGGLPNGEYLGRIGLAQSRQDPMKLYAIVDNQTPRPMGPRSPERLSAAAFQAMNQEDFLKLEDERMELFLSGFVFPEDFKPEKIRKDLKEGTLKFEDFKTHVKHLQNVPKGNPKCVGPELYVTTDAGATWTKTHTADLWDQVDWGYGTATYYFQRIAVDPSDDKRVVLSTVPLLKTEDGGRTFGFADEHGDDVHADHHAILFSQKDARRVLLGNDGGLNQSLDGGKTWRAIKNLPVAQCYTVTTDMATPYRIYAGLQDNGISMGPARPLKPFQEKDSWRSIWGADGMFVQVNPKDNNTVYLGTQFGAMSRLNLATRENKSIRPKPDFPKEPPFRPNWVTPIVMSSFHPDLVYTGTQFVHRSFDKGETWTNLPQNLASEGQKGSFVNIGGDVSYGTISALAESPKRFGLLYAGTDEGWLWVSKDAGATWTRCLSGLPTNKWVTRVEPSHHAEGTVYATLTGFRENDPTAYVFKSTDFGTTWKSIKGNLPDECVNVIREDAVNPDLLYLGTDFGVFASLDGGARWEVLGGEMPTVPAYDLHLQTREKDLVVGTYGRSVWVGKVKVLQEYKVDVRTKPLHLFTMDSFKVQPWWEKEKPVQAGKPREIDPVELYYHAQKPGKATLRLQTEKGDTLRAWELEATTGLNRLSWDCLIDAAKRDKLPEGRRPFIQPGKYTFLLSQGEQQSKTELVVEAQDTERRGRRRDVAEVLP